MVQCNVMSALLSIICNMLIAITLCVERVLSFIPQRPDGCNNFLPYIFGIWLQSPQQKLLWVLIFVVQCQETTPTNSFTFEISVCGSLSQFSFSRYCSALEKCEILHPTKFPVHVSSLIFSTTISLPIKAVHA